MKEAIPTGRRLVSQTNPDNFRECLATLESFRKLFLIVYIGLVQEKLIQPIESLPEAEKNKLKDQARKTDLPQAAKIDLCRCLWALEYFENEPKENNQ